MGGVFKGTRAARRTETKQSCTSLPNYAPFSPQSVNYTSCNKRVLRPILHLLQAAAPKEIEHSLLRSSFHSRLNCQPPSEALRGDVIKIQADKMIYDQSSLNQG